MRISVKAKPGAFRQLVEQIDKTHFVVSVREPPDKGLANLAIRAALAEFLKISPSRITQKTGFVSRQKIFEIK